MPLDTTINVLNAPVPAHLSFPVGYENTRFHKSKYVVNEATDEILGIVGKTFNCASHLKFFEGVQETMVETLSDQDLSSVDVKWRSARGNAWAMMDLRMNNVVAKIANDKFQTTINPRVIALHGIDGSCSNQVYFGSIDAFCTNGMISGTYDTVKRKNSARFDMDVFKKELRQARRDFFVEAERMNGWLNKQIPLSDVKELIESIVKSDRKAEKMTSLYFTEAATRGHNVFALYSAFTNYASYADERNGFTLKNTGNDTQSESMWKREQEVNKWVSSDRFQRLLQAA